MKQNENKKEMNRWTPWFVSIIITSLLMLLFWHSFNCENHLIEYENRVDSCLNVIKLQKLQMEAISNIYNVNFEKLQSLKADSAFILLEMYRDKLHYDSINKCWYIVERINETKEIIKINNYKVISEKKIKRDTTLHVATIDSVN